MGDRTNVSFEFMKDDSDKLKLFLDLDDESTILDAFHVFNDDGTLVNIDIEEVSYGDLKINDWAVANGVPYSYWWDPGSGYTEGAEHLRFNESGEPELIIYENKELELSVEGTLSILEEAKEMTAPEESYDHLAAFLESKVKHINPLPLAEQGKNKLRRRTINLLTS